MKILQISFHTAPFGNIGKNDSGGLNVYVENISKQLSKNNTVVVATAEEAKSFKKDNLEFQSFNLFNQDLTTEDKESYLQEFIDLCSYCNRFLCCRTLLWRKLVGGNSNWFVGVSDSILPIGSFFDE